jgi:hypothetical protein
MRWTDISSYSQNDKERIPTVYQLKVDDLIIRVHRHIHYPKDTWLLSSSKLDIDHHELRAKDIKEAQEEALDIARKGVENLVEELEQIQRQLG